MQRVTVRGHALNHLPGFFKHRVDQPSKLFGLHGPVSKLFDEGFTGFLTARDLIASGNDKGFDEGLNSPFQKTWHLEIFGYYPFGQTGFAREFETNDVESKIDRG
ncbi:hypothetical protein PHJA_000531300 [Phtheirospermum japonicum]|uniref:Uncharacterized protein n=1 Tax=Phtheirospermum japonicum TaxID=374723 RepID=A0A830B9W2_9LAMI|nr:hypothetical protein PHJA_000531300 [Phtheirospermum japonicum]